MSERHGKSGAIALVLGVLTTMFGCGNDNNGSAADKANVDGGFDASFAASSPVGLWAETVSGAFNGNLSYVENGTASFSNGGTATWTLSGKQLTVTGSLSGAAFSDSLTLSDDGKTLSGQNAGGLAIVETRVLVTPVGRWGETLAGSAVGEVTYGADWRVTYSNGDSGTWTIANGKVTVSGVGAGGAFTDQLTFSPDGNTLTGEHTGDAAVVETREP